MNMMKKNLLIILLCFFLFSAACAQSEGSSAAYSRVIDVPSLGPVQYYAQNDPLWQRMYYEPNPTQYRRRFGEGGCGPVTAAMAIAKQLDSDKLPALLAHSKGTVKDFAFCSCSVNGEFCDESYRRAKYGTSDPNHREFSPVSGLEFKTWLPVIFASYAAGNNDHTYQLRKMKENGTEIFLFNALASDYGLEYTGTRNWDEALAALRQGASVITTVTQGIFTNGSHYLFLAGVDEEYLYIMDSDMREKYGKDKHSYLEVLEPGLSRVRLENVPDIDLYSFYVINRPQEDQGQDQGRDQGGITHADTPRGH